MKAAHPIIQPHTRSIFSVLLVLALAAAVTALGLLVSWLRAWLGPHHAFTFTGLPALLGNDPNGILAWHPVLMYSAFGILMAAAVVSYTDHVPGYRSLER